MFANFDSFVDFLCEHEITADQFLLCYALHHDKIEEQGWDSDRQVYIEEGPNTASVFRYYNNVKAWSREDFDALIDRGLLEDHNPREPERKSYPDKFEVTDKFVDAVFSGEKNRKERIREIRNRRGISSLMHFTRLDHVPSILRHGILPRSELSSHQVTFNDQYRYDGHREANCMSIGFPNYQMFYRYRMDSETSWVVIEAKSKILWELDCAFCKENAASNVVRHIPLNERKRPEALEKMFEKYKYGSREVSRKDLGIPKHFATHPQAEVLVFDAIKPSYFETIHFESQSDKERCEDKLKKQGITLDSSLSANWSRSMFEPRADWKSWKDIQESRDAREADPIGDESNGKEENNSDSDFDPDDMLPF